MQEPMKMRHIEYSEKVSKENIESTSEYLRKKWFPEIPGWAVALKGFRYREGLTQAQLSELSGIHQANISLMERGKRPIGKKIAMKLGEILHTDYRRFL